MQMAIIPRTAQGHGWLRPAVGVVELSQCVIQVSIVRLNAVTDCNKILISL